MPLGDMCWCGKIMYPSKQAAWAQIMNLPAHRVNRKTLDVYWCYYSGAWHLRSNLRFGRKRRKKRS